MKYKICCDTCWKEMDFDVNKYEEHIKKYHPKKTNVKKMCFKAHIWRQK